MQRLGNFAISNRVPRPKRSSLRIIAGMSDAAVDVHFLRAEAGSSRYRAGLLRELTVRGLDLEIIDQPDLESADENGRRKSILHEVTRHDGPTKLFAGFPSDVDWYVTVVDVGSLSNATYVNLPNWTAFSGGSRRVADGARAAIAGAWIDNISNADFQTRARAIRSGEPILRPILVAKDEASEPVILDGHLRVTALLMLHIAERASAPVELEVIVGFSPSFAGWPMF